MVKLHFGCGKNNLLEWSNLDLPKTDVRQPLKYKHDSVDYIFHEHMLEHLDEVDGYNFLKECFRILKPAGKMRISIPSLDGFIECYDKWDTGEVDDRFKKQYRSRTDFMNKVILGEAAHYKAKMLTLDMQSKIYNNSEAWHKFYYTFDDLSSKLNVIGFIDVARQHKHQSSDPNLTKLERRFGGKFDLFPPMLDLVLECTKPTN